MKRKRLPFAAALGLGVLLCLLPFGLLPLALYHAPDGLLQLGLLFLLYIACPLLSLLVPGWLSYRGLAPLASCLLPTVGSLLVLLYGMGPVGWVLILSLVLGVLSATVGEELRKREKKKA